VAHAERAASEVIHNRDNLLRHCAIRLWKREYNRRRTCLSLADIHGCLQSRFQAFDAFHSIRKVGSATHATLILQRSFRLVLARRRVSALRQLVAAEETMIKAATDYSTRQRLKQHFVCWKRCIHRLMRRMAVLTCKAVMRRNLYRWRHVTQSQIQMRHVAELLMCFGRKGMLRDRWRGWVVWMEDERRKFLVDSQATEYSKAKEKARALTRWEAFR
jgi:hypothetical protein